ncbi:MAG: PASTA domain-containing protein [Oscillospiraceae bacterium]|nr:PASTA domain-containing protein [Oscillospiraceae bacterium]
MSYQPTNRMRFKLNLIVLPLFLVFTALIIVNLFNTSVKENAKYQALANENQFGSTIVKANRGSIYDTNGKILAQSATVYSINVNPNMIYTQQKKEEKEEAEGKEHEGIAESQRMINAAATILSDELNVTYEYAVEKLTKNGENSKWANIAKSIEKPIADNILARAEEEDIGGLIYTELDTKRYYPQAELAASVIGFTNYDGDGVYGVEASYNSYLKGVDGKIISAKDGYGNEMPYKNDKMYSAQDGNSVYLTIDTTLQYIVEKYLKQQVDAHRPEDRACAIMMNPKTGAILAMATVPGYDLNDKNSLYNPDDAALLAGITDDEEYNEKYTALREQQWKNKAISEIYFPGSVFKVITGSSALEERVINMNSTFSCGRIMQVADVPFGCWASYSHGSSQDFTTAMTNSCNPAFIQIGQLLGKDKFYEYFKAYGFTEKTGIDLPGEVDSLYTNTSEKGPVELASSSFGQTNKVTPIQMITAYAAVINGGYLVTPYVVSKIVDTNGNVVKTTEPSIKRQVISEETSAQMRKVLESVVNTNGGSNAYIKGYNIGGKSGTSQKMEEINRTGNEDLYVASYCAFAPADDPEIIMLVMVDQPTAKDQNGALMYYGSIVAVPAVANTLKEALPQLGYYPEYTEAELEALGITLPSVEGQDSKIAVETLEKMNLQVTVIGNGDKVVAQVPARRSSIPRNGKVILYTEENYDTQYTEVPNIIGYGLSDVNTILTNADLNFKVGDGAANQSGAVAYSQNYAEGCIVPAGTIIEVTFITKDQG